MSDEDLPDESSVAEVDPGVDSDLCAALSYAIGSMLPVRMHISESTPGPAQRYRDMNYDEWQRWLDDPANVVKHVRKNV